MSILVPTATSARSTVTAASQQFSFTMAGAEIYIMTSSIACYILQGANPIAYAADNNTYVAAGQCVPIYAGAGAKLAIIRAGAVDGEATLTKAIRI